MQLPNISNQIYKSIKYYDEHAKVINARYIDEDDVKEYVQIWLGIQCRLAWEKYHAEMRKELGIHC